MGSQAQDPAKERVRLMEENARLRRLLPSLIALAEIGEDRLKKIHRDHDDPLMREATALAVAQAARDIATARELVGE